MRLSFATGFLCACLGLGLGFTQARAQSSTTDTAAALQAAQTGPQLSSGSSALGGPFTAVNQNGVPLTQKSFAGHYALLTFGYVNCGDGCSPAPATIQAALAQLPVDTAAKIYPVFVTVDPARDTPAALKGFLAPYGPRFVGMTGSPGEMDRLASAYQVYSQRVEDPAAAIEGRLSPQDLAELRRDPAYQPPVPGAYTIDHSRAIYLLDPKGAISQLFGPAMQAADLAKALKDNVN